MAASTRSKKSNGVFYALMGLLVLGLGGFGVQNFSGGVRSIGKVGDREISVNDYAIALRNKMNEFSQQVGTQITFQQAQALGIDRSARTQIVTQAALDNETARLGISVGDDRVRTALLAIPAFRDVTGNFDRETYAFTLKQNGQSEREFEARVRDEAARTLVQTAVLGGVGVPPAYVDTIFAYLEEKRGFSWVSLDAAGLTPPLAAPDAAQIKTYYDANPEAFTQPEAKAITYVKLLPDMLVDKVEVPEEQIQKAYDARLSEFVQPERRLVERLVFATDADAATAKARLDAGAVTFEALVSERNLALSDIDLGDADKTSLGAAGDAVFALTEPGIVGPFASDLGPALFRMNGILAAQETSIDDVRADLRTELALDIARKQILTSAEAISDQLAGGATLEQLADETDMELGTVDYFTGSEDAMAAYPEFQAAAEALTADAYPEAIGLSDGGMVAMRLDAMKPAELKPMADVQPDVIAAWTADETQKRLMARAEEIKAALAAATTDTLGVTLIQVDPIKRDGTLDGAPATLMEAVFKLKPGEAQILEEPGKVTVATLTTILPADTAPPAEGSDAAKLRTGIAQQLSQSLAGDLFDLYATALQIEAGIQLDETAIRAVESQIQ